MLFQPLKPMLLTMRREAFNSTDFLFEPKWDGYRMLIHKQGDRIEAYTRNGTRMTERFPELAQVVSSIRAHSAILDCEGVCMRDGRSVFDDFQHRGRLSNQQKIEVAVKTHPVTFVAFDVLYTDQDHTQQPLTERKKLLYSIVESSGVLMPTLHMDGSWIALKRLTEDRGCEGIVAKRKDSRYHFGIQSTEWIKIKNWRTIDTVILGYRTDPQFALVAGLHFRNVSASRHDC